MLPVPLADVFYICRMCEHLDKAYQAGRDTCDQENCGGPWRGDTFSKYNGPLPEHWKKNYCLFCGKESDFIIGVGNNFIGVCKACRIKLDKRMENK